MRAYDREIAEMELEDLVAELEETRGIVKREHEGRLLRGKYGQEGGVICPLVTQCAPYFTRVMLTCYV